MLDRKPGKTIADLKRELPKTYQSPTMSPHCDDEKKYGVVDKVMAALQGRLRPTAAWLRVRRSGNLSR